MSKAYLTFAAMPGALMVSSLAFGVNYLVAQEHIRRSAIEAPPSPPDDTATRPHVRQQATEAPALALDDATIVAIFDNANTVDIETGRLAAGRGWTSEVRQFGAMLARDHDMVRQQGRDLAKKLGVTPTPPVGDRSAEDQTAVIRRLNSLRGPEFDRAFLEREIQFHRDVIAAIETTLLPAIKNEELRALVVKVAPAFQAHLVMAENLLTRVATK
jgi:putative membrane protein